MTPEETCAQLGDAGTVLFNAENSFREGRSTQQEIEGAWRLATRMYSRVEVEPGTALAEAVDALKADLHVVPLGAVDQEYMPGESRIRTDNLVRACETAGAQGLSVESWTGG